MKKIVITAALLALVSFAFAEPGWTKKVDTKPRISSFPNTEQLGRYVVRYKDDVVQVVAGYRYASQNHDQEWILVEIGMSAAGRDTVVIDRENIELLAPDGTRIGLPSQEQFQAQMGQIQRYVKAASVQRDRVGEYFVGKTRIESVPFFSTPEEPVVHDQVTLQERTLNQGNLWFRAPSGQFVDGLYTLVIKNRDVRVEMPIELRQKKKKPRKG